MEFAAQNLVELKEGTNIIATEQNDVIAIEILTELNYAVVKTIDKAYGNRMVVHPSQRENLRNPSNNKSNSVFTNNTCLKSY